MKFKRLRWTKRYKNDHISCFDGLFHDYVWNKASETPKATLEKSRSSHKNVNDNFKGGRKREHISHTSSSD